MRNIVVVDCRSTGKNYIADIVSRGYNPVVLHLKAPDTYYGEQFTESVYKGYETIPFDFDMIYERDSFEETLEEVKKFTPLLIVPGAEAGVRLATKLSYELNLLGNPIENIDAMTLKNEMHNRLAENGLRSIRGKVVKSLEEALEFYDSECLSEVVIKPIYSAGSASVRICLSRDELIDAIRLLFNDVNRYGEINEELLVQERIRGTEYIVNTVSHNGVHRVTLVWKYNKVKTSEGAVIYDSCETVNELNLGEAKMIEYAYNVADALGIQYGPVHGEYMIDESGPVLIEVNCRPCGGNMSAEFLDRISGQHETDSILDSYLKPERFHEKLKKRYELYSYGVVKFFIVPKNIIARSSSIGAVSNRLKSYFDFSFFNIDYDKVSVPKTMDLKTSPGYVFLVHEDKSEVVNNLNFLRAIEKNAFSLILSDDSADIIEKDDEVYLSEIKPLVENTSKYGTGLFVTDQFLDDVEILQVGYEEIDELMNLYDFIVINLNKSLMDKPSPQKTRIILEILLKLKTGGIVFIPENTYQFMANGRMGVEALIKVLDYKIELPPYNIRDVIIASRTL